MQQKWVCLSNFHELFADERFYLVLRNTLAMSIMGLILGFTVPIIYALLINELRGQLFKRTIQTVSYLPHFVLPLCQPVLATIALFIAVNHWNAWFDTYLYNSQNPEYTTLQYELRKVLLTTDNGTNYRDPNKQQSLAAVTPESIQMAITMVVTVPILLVYPFLQRYFAKGLTLGAVKS